MLKADFDKKQNRGGRKALIFLLSAALVFTSSGFSQAIKAFAVDDADDTANETVGVEQSSFNADESSEDVRNDASQETNDEADKSETSDAADSDSASESSGQEANSQDANAAAPSKKSLKSAPLRAPAAGDYQIQNSDITSLTTSVKRTTSSGSTWEETNSVGDGDAVKFDIKYHIDAGSVTNGKMYYELPAGITNLDTSSTFNIINGSNPSETLGTYVIAYDNATGKYTIEMTLDDSFNYQQAFDGTISVEGEAKNNKTSGNDIIDFGGSNTVTVSQERSVADFSLRKQGGARTPDGAGGGTVSFEYFLGSYNGTNEISINDVATAQNVDIDFSKDLTITYRKGTYRGGTPYPENFTGWASSQTKTVSGANFKSGVTYTLPALDAMEGYWVTYTVPYKADPNDNGEEKKLNNTVTANTTNAPEASSSAGTTWDKPSIKKTSSKPSNNKATWTITIGESGQDLSGFVLKDVLTTDPAVALSSLNIQQPKTMTITSINGNAANKTISLTNGEYTFPEGTTGYLVLKYTTTLPIIPSSTVKLINTATLTTDEGTDTAVAEEEFVGVPGNFALSKLGPDELDGGDTTNTAVKDGDDITMSWRSTITLPGAGHQVDLEDIYYYDYTQINGSSSSSPDNNWVTKNTLKDDLVITNSSGDVLQRNVDYVVYTDYQSDSPTYTTIKGYYDNQNSGYHRLFNIDQNGYTNSGYEQTLPDAKQARFQILFINDANISGQNYLTIDYKTYGTLPDEGDINTYKNNAKITASSEMSAEHVETMEQSGVTLEKKIQEEPGSDNYVEPANWWYNSNSDKNIVGYKIRGTYNPDAPVTTIVIKDQLPEGMEYVDGSGKVAQERYVKTATTFVKKDVDLDSSKYSVSYDASTRTITVTITDYDTTTGIMPAFGIEWGPYPIDNVDFFYKAKLTDSAWNNKSTTQKRYVNTTWIDGSDDQVTATTNFMRPSDNNTKGSVRVTDYDANDDPVTDTQHEMYYLIINPQSKDLDSDSDRITVEDTVTLPDHVAAEFIYDEVAVYEFNDQIPKNPSADDLTGTAVTDFTYTYDEHNHKLTVDVPDEKGLVIVYGYRYSKTTDGSASVTNTATIKGVGDSTSGDSISVEANNTSATVTQRNFHIRKIEEGNSGKLLEGSKFELVRYEGYKASGNEKVVVDTIDNTTGKAEIILQSVIGSTGSKTSDEAAEKTLFSLRETVVPEGYTADKTKLYFFAWKNIEDTDAEAYDKLQTAYNAAKQSDWPAFPSQDEITFASNTGTLNVENAPQEEPEEELIDISGTKTWVDGGLIHNNDTEITLTLKRSVEGGSAETVNATPTWDGNTYTFSDLPKVDGNGDTYTYTVEEAAISRYSTEQSGYNFTNTKDKGQLTISKSVAGNDADTSKKFTFTIKLTQADGTTPVTGTFSGVTFDSTGTATVELADGESKTIETYVDIKYTVTEDADGYYSEDGTKTGTISSTASTATFTNTKVKKSLPLKLTKNLDGAAASTADQFTFTMKGTSPDTNTYDKTAKNNASGKATFDGIEYTQADAGKTYVYEVKETAASGYECDSSTYTVSDAIAWNTDKTDITITRTIKKGSANADAVSFDNYTLIDISGNKTWVDGGLSHTNSSEVTLTLKRSVTGGTEETVDATPTWTGDTYKYSGLRKTDDDGNEYKYTVTETKVQDYLDPEYSNYDITNTREQGDLTIEKEITGNDISSDDEFTFTITLKDKDGNYVSGNVSGKHTPSGETEEDVTLAFSDGKATYKLKGGDKLTITYYVGTTYEVEETDKKDYTNTDGKKTGTLTTTESPVKYTNTRDTFGDLAIKKVLAGNDQDTSKGFNFTVTLKDKDDQPIANTTFGDHTTDAEGKITLSIKGGETETITGLPNDTKYEVTEDDYSSEGYEPVQLSTNKTGTIAGDLPDNSLVTVTATNKKDTYGDIKVKKIETGNDTGFVEDFEFTATFTDGDDNPVAELEVGSYTTDSDGKITFTIKAGSEETLTSIPNGIQYVIEETDYSADGYDAVSWDKNPRGTIKGGIGENSLVEFTATNNRDTYGDIELTKLETGNDTGVVTDFEFTITASYQDGSPLEGPYGVAEFEDGVAIISLQAGESKKIADLPNGVKYTIEEKDYTDKGYDPVDFGADNGTKVSKTIAGDQGTNSEVSFTATNNRDTYADLRVSKKLSGNDTDPDKKFAFTVKLTDADDNPISGTKFGDYTTNANGIIHVNLKGGDEIVLENLPNGTKYEVNEADYSSDFYDLTWQGDNDPEGIIVGGTPDNAEYNVVAENHRESYGNIKLSKSVSGDYPDAGTKFKFTLTFIDADGKPLANYDLEEYKTDANGVVEVGIAGGDNAFFANVPNGTTYSITEDDYSEQGYILKWNNEPTEVVMKGDPEGVTYEYTATNNYNPEYDKRIIPPKDEEKDDAPVNNNTTGNKSVRTGDNSKPGLYAVLMLLSAAAVGMVFRRRRKSE